MERVPAMRALDKIIAQSVTASIVLMVIVFGVAPQTAAAKDLDEATGLNEQTKKMYLRGRFGAAGRFAKPLLWIREE